MTHVNSPIMKQSISLFIFRNHEKINIFRDICNFAVLKLEYYQQLQDGFKDWADALRTRHLLNKTEALISLEYFDQKKDSNMFESLRMPDMPLEVNDPLLAVHIFKKLKFY